MTFKQAVKEAPYALLPAAIIFGLYHVVSSGIISDFLTESIGFEAPPSNPALNKLMTLISIASGTAAATVGIGYIVGAIDRKA